MRKFTLFKLFGCTIAVAAGVKVGIRIGKYCENGIRYIAEKVSKCAESIKNEFSN